MSLFTLATSDRTNALLDKWNPGEAFVVAQLKPFTVAKVFGHPGGPPLFEHGGWHVDLQKFTDKGEAVIQIQRGVGEGKRSQHWGVGKGKKSTVACVLVPSKYRDEIENVSKNTRLKDEGERMTRQLSDAVKAGLWHSVTSRMKAADGGSRVIVYRVTGEFTRFER